MKRLLFLLSFLSSICYGQKIEKYYNYQWRETEASKARFYGLIEKTDSGWHRRDYFLRENRLQMDGLYEDDSCKYANGSFKYYHANGFFSGGGKFLHGKRQGLWVHYYDNGMMEDSGYYENGKAMGIHLSLHRNGYPADSTSWQPDGSGVIVAWFDNGVPAYAGRYLAGKRNGPWQFFHKNGNLSAKEIYANGQLRDKQYFDEAGNAITDTTNHDREADFPGGMQAWSKYLSKKLYFPEQYKLVNTDQVVVVVDFTIDENGKVKDIAAAVPFHPAFDKIALDAVRRSPDWTPAIQQNRKVSFRQRQAITFAQQDDL